MRRLHIAILLCLGVAPFYLNGIYNPRLAGTPRLFWLAEVAAWVAMPLLILVWGTYRALFKLDDLGFHTRIRGRPSPGLLVFSILVVAILALPIDRALVNWATRTVPPAPSRSTFQYEAMLPPPGPTPGAIACSHWLTCASQQGSSRNCTTAGSSCSPSAAA